MAYLLISDFKGGLDRRRPRVAGVAGSLWTLTNGVISRGGDIEKAGRFVPLYLLPVGKTRGLAQINGQLIVFGVDAPGSVAVPAGLVYQQLAAPDGSGLLRILDVKSFDSRTYVIAEYADGDIYHFFNGARVTAWDTIAASLASFTALAAHLADRLASDRAVRVTPTGSSIVLRAKAPGVPFSVSATGGTVTTLQPNVAAVANVDAVGTVTITGGSADQYEINRIDQVTAGGTNLISRPVLFGASISATANALAVAINNATSTHGYSAEAQGATVRITAPPNTGALANGRAIVVALGGNVTTTAAPFANGVSAVSPVAQVARVDFSGTIGLDTSYVVTLNGAPSRATGRAAGMGVAAFIYKSRVYSPVQSLVYYSKLNDPMNWSDTAVASGAGFINIANEASAVGRLQAMARYNTLAVIFGRETIFTYQLGTDASANQSEQPLENTGTIAPDSIVTYGASDVFYLDETGIRSLRARAATDAAFVSDIGTVIDSYIQDLRAAASPDAVQRAQAVVEPVDGRYWLSIGQTIVTLSNFPASKVTAWSALSVAFVPEAFVRSRREVYARAGDMIYLYGGLDGADLVPAGAFVVETPFLDGGTPATIKQITGFDISCKGTWRIEMLVDPNDETKIVDIGRVVDSTMHRPAIGVDAQTSAFAIRATCISEGEASISQMAVHYKPREAA